MFSGIINGGFVGWQVTDGPVVQTARTINF